MNCPVCNRNNAFNLSICPSCGAMMNDTVRREPLPKISVSKPLPKIDVSENGGALASGKLNRAPGAAIVKEASGETIDNAPEILAKNQTTENIAVKQTSPTLVEFHSDKSTVPEWRLQLQNVVRKRQDRENPPTETFSAPVAAATVSARPTRHATSGANALKIESVQEKKPARHKNPTLTSALERIEKSRQKFYVESEEELIAAPAPTTTAAPRPATKNFPFYIAAKQTSVDAPPKQEETSIESAKPQLAAEVAARNESGELDTNKLPPLASVVKQATVQPILQPAKISTSFTKTEPKIEAKTDAKTEIEPTEIKETTAPEIDAEHPEESEDFAPFALRFNAGLFDLIIGAFLSLVLLAPFILTASGETTWFSFTGVLAFLATCSIVMFIYLTTTVGFYGRTFGMRLFSLEVVDIEGENYPTLHQAAVSAAVYLLSLAFGGAGFLTLLFNEDRRAAHDLASGTIVVKEI